MTIEPVFFLLLTLVLALLEIEIEGKYGWAEKTATWYRTSGIWGKLIPSVLGGKPSTGYHTYMNLLLLLFLHTPFYFGDMKWSLSNELIIISVFFMLSVVWDFLWFVLNPEYTVRNFKKENIWWHNKNYWILGLFPSDYLKGVLVSIAFAYGAYLLGYQSALMDGILLVAYSALFISICIIAAPWYHKVLLKMRLRDDRDKAGIFHKNLKGASAKINLDEDLRELKEEALVSEK